ncbi:MAG TPA: hypothetical protein VEA37_06710, partial [Flavobacterium sp.]|nr:hypothetical protein [Flavobacterium sp.]
TYMNITKDRVQNEGLNWERFSKQLSGQDWVFVENLTTYRLINIRDNKKIFCELLGDQYCRSFEKLGEEKTQTIFTESIGLNGRFFPNVILFKGSNQKRFWTKNNARKEGLGRFRDDFQSVYLSSEEFRRFVATPELEKICKRILKNHSEGKYSQEGEYWSFKSDFAELYVAAKKHNIKSEFADQLYEFLQKQAERPGWFEKHPIWTGLLWCFLLPLLKWIRQLLRRKHKPS